MNTLNRHDYFYARRFAWDLLRRLFMEEPTPALLSYLKHEHPFRLFPHLEDTPAVDRAREDIAGFLAEREFQAEDADFDDLHWDFTRLFIGPEAPLAPPWESVYVSRDKLLFQKNTQLVQQYYQTYGFRLASGELEAADHIGFELDFLYHLSEQTVALTEAGAQEGADFQRLLAAQLTFLRQHLLAFVEPFSRHLYNHAQTDFYRALSTVLTHFAQQDARRLALETRTQTHPV